MYSLFYILLIGINLSIFIFFKLDVWHASGFFAQCCLLLMFSWSFFENPKNQIKTKNIALGMVHLWVGASAAAICYFFLIEGKYNVKNFYTYFNFLCLVVMYKLVVEYLDYEKIDKLMITLKYVLIGSMFLAVLQKFGLAQFFELYYKNAEFNNNSVVGFVGNGTHLSGFLASCTPVFLYKTDRKDILSLVMMFFLMFFTGTTVNDPSISGFIIMPALILAFFLKDKKIFIPLLLSCIAAFNVLILLFHSKLETFTSFNGRIEVWQYYWEVFKQNMPVTGIGIGRVNQIYQDTPHPLVRHLHLEYFQFLLELGIVGFVVVINLIRDFFSRKSFTDLQWILKLCVLGFCLSCFFNFPAHLWIPSTYCMFFYASYIAIENNLKQG